MHGILYSSVGMGSGFGFRPVQPKLGDFDKDSLVKEQAHTHPNRDSSIRQIKDRSEKNKIIPSPNRKPIRQKSLEKGEIQHINHPTIHPILVAKQAAVKQRIHDIATGPGPNQGQGDGSSGSGKTFVNRISEISTQTNHGDKSKGGEQ